MRNRAWEKANPDNMRRYKRESARRAYAKNPEKYRARARERMRTLRKERPEVARRAQARFEQAHPGYSKKWREATPELQRLYSRRTAKKHRARISDREMTRRLADPERAREIQRTYYRKHPARRSASAKQWRQSNRDTVRAQKRRHYYRYRPQFLAVMSLTHGRKRASLIAELSQRQQGECSVCAIPFVEGDRIEIDHYIPKCKGGGSEKDNLRAAHYACNRAKGRQMPTAAKRAA